MKKVLKYVLDVGFIGFIAWFTLRMVFKGQEFGEILEDLSMADPRWVSAGAAAVFCFIAGESCIIYYMLRLLGQRLFFPRCLKYSFIGFFFSYITPSSSGGQPAQMYYMKKDGVKIGLSTLVMLLITIAYKSALVLMGAVCLIFGRRTVHQYSGEYLWLIILGFALNFIFIALLWYMFIKPDKVRKLGLRVVNILGDLHMIKEEKHRRAVEKITRICEGYTMSAAYIREDPKAIVTVFGITTVQRLCLFSLPWLIYKSYGLSGVGFMEMLVLQIILGVAVEMLPLPGAAGITEACFLMSYDRIFGEELVKPALLLSRGLSFYAVLIVGGIVTLIAHIIVLRADKSIDLQKQQQAQERREAVQSRAAAIKDSIKKKGSK